MGLKPITAPPVEPLTLNDAYVQCQIDTISSGSPATISSPHDAWITATIPVVRQQAENELARALITQTWELSLHDFPRGLVDEHSHDGRQRYHRPYDWRAIQIPLPPLQRVSSVTYLDGNGDLQPLDPSAYVVDDSVTPAQITPARGSSWPEVLTQPGAVKIRFVAGYAPTGSPADYRANVPPAIKHWMLLVLANWFRNREATWQVVSSQTLENAPYVDAMLFPYRVLGHDV
jgi:uncharacterized phiE125 gp8 family phage protein